MTRSQTGEMTELANTSSWGPWGPRVTQVVAHEDVAQHLQQTVLDVLLQLGDLGSQLSQRCRQRWTVNTDTHVGDHGSSTRTVNTDTHVSDHGLSTRTVNTARQVGNQGLYKSCQQRHICDQGLYQGYQHSYACRWSGTILESTRAVNTKHTYRS